MSNIRQQSEMYCFGTFCYNYLYFAFFKIVKLEPEVKFARNDDKIKFPSGGAGYIDGHPSRTVDLSRYNDRIVENVSQSGPGGADVGVQGDQKAGDNCWISLTKIRFSEPKYTFFVSSSRLVLI